MSDRAHELSLQALGEFARDPGRSVAVVVRSPAGEWRGGARDDVPRPAASVLKLGIAMAAERILRTDPNALAHRAPAEAILTGDPSPSALRAVHPRVPLGPADVLGLMVSLSDNPCATWLADAVGEDAVRRALARAGIENVGPVEPGRCIGPLSGRCTAVQALDLVALAADASQHPLTAAAMEHVVHAARIPLGVERDDIRMAHKTGSLAGVANDVAVIECHDMQVRVAFLTEDQHDPLVTGYEMGICTRRILRAWGLGARGSRSFAAP